MTKTEVSGLETTIQKTHEWLEDLAEIGGFFGPQQAYTALHAVLHTLRDTLQINEAVQLASGLPMLIRGMYFEGWKPAHVPVPARHKQDFLDRVGERLRNAQIDPEHACRSVFTLLDMKIDAGEIEDVRRMLHHTVRPMFD
ncbi:MAG TPA: DUF2267 domain-containing protein [Phycisphaerae bacterium]